MIIFFNLDLKTSRLGANLISNGKEFHILTELTIFKKSSPSVVPLYRIVIDMSKLIRVSLGIKI